MIPGRVRKRMYRPLPISEQAYFELEKKYGVAAEEMRKMVRNLKEQKPGLEMNLVFLAVLAKRRNMTDNKSELLHKPIALLPVSSKFREAMGRQDIKTLDEIMNVKVSELVNLKWFTNEILAELSELLFSDENQ